MARSVMAHRFSMVPKVNIPRSRFDRSHGYKTTFDSGYLIPFYADEALPGDSFDMRATIFARLTTPIVPFMDNLHMETFYFAVPIRLIWDNWERFNGAQDDPDDSTEYLVPVVKSPKGAVGPPVVPAGWQTGSLSDYLGLPIGIADLEVCAFWHRAYNLIWNEWFRDENLQDSVPVPRGDGPDTSSSFELLKRGKRHDYFTSALPWPQKGPGVELALSGNAPVVGRYLVASPEKSLQKSQLTSNDSADQSIWHKQAIQAAGVQPLWSVQDDTLGGLYADLSSVNAATINSLRQAFQLQKLLERDARGGTRYTEIIRSHFGVVSPDARLQRPEYLGGSRSRVKITPVQQTSESTTTGTPQGNLAAFGLVSDSHHGFSKSFTEHCVLLGLVQVTADLTYQQGINRMFNRQTRYDFYWPAFAHLGEQAILNKEIYAQGPGVKDLNDNVIDEDVFGYQERYAEYRYKPSQITGKLRSQASGSLDVWHLSQKFASLPELGSTFIEDNPPLARVLAIANEPQFVMDCYMQLKCARPMPVYSVPGYMDHF